MKIKFAASLCKVIGDESAQVIPWAIFLMVMFIGMAGLVVDVGDAYYQQRLLQSSTDAAALAAAYGLNTSKALATSDGTLYSSTTGNNNAFGNLSTVTVTVTPYCSTTLVAQGTLCTGPSGDNAVTVTQTAKVNTYFVGIFGVTSIPIQSTATGEISGTPQPSNIILMLDTTASMGDPDSSCGATATRLDCAKQAAVSMMESIYPCASTTAVDCTATSGGGSLNRISIFTFPNVSEGSLAYEYGCATPTSGEITIPVYAMPTSTLNSSSTYSPGTGATYQITSFASDYRTTDLPIPGTLNTSSEAVRAVGGATAGGCGDGMLAKGGDGTYYAGVIYAASAALLAENAAYPGSQNVIIMISDGAATSAQDKMAGTATNSGLYGTSAGSYIDECGQAITAAKAAQSEGIIFYTVAFGAPSTGCTTDTKTGSGLTVETSPCTALSLMATGGATGDFYSDYIAGNTSTSACEGVNSGTATTSLTAILNQIAVALNSRTRLIPVNTP
jgi:Flp pilus assembly protein TadG